MLNDDYETIINETAEEHSKRVKAVYEQKAEYIKEGRNTKGRKIRSDKGVKRKSTNYGGGVKKGYKQTNFAKYNIVLGKRLKSKNSDDLTVICDDNGYYIDIDAKYHYKYGSFPCKIRGKNTTRYSKRTKRVTTISLERYRFNAWKEKATSMFERDTLVPLPYADLNRWLYEAYGMDNVYADAYLKNKRYTWYTLFLDFYHIKEEQIDFWDYDTWVEHYNRTPKDLLPIEFKFDLSNKPGSTFFHPEWSYIQDLKEEDKIREEEKKKEIKSFIGRHSRTKRNNEKRIKDNENE